MDTTTLKTILLEEMQKYAKKGLNAYSYLTENHSDGVYAVIDMADVNGKRLVGAVLIAHLLDDRIVIDLDLNDKPLVDALVARGVEQSRIVLAYRDDIMPA